jgi:hypothetical protein
VDSDVTVPATFTISPGGKLSPPAVSVPSKVLVALRVSDRDHAAHLVVLTASRLYSLHVGAGGDAGLQIPGLPDGTYRILVDGVARGELSVGAQGGP